MKAASLWLALLAALPCAAGHGGRDNSSGNQAYGTIPSPGNQVVSSIGSGGHMPLNPYSRNVTLNRSDLAAGPVLSPLAARAISRRTVSVVSGSPVVLHCTVRVGLHRDSGPSA